MPENKPNCQRKMAVEQTWRWFGPNDPITLKEIRKTGATGIVTALHHVPVGEPWTIEEITKRKDVIKAEGLKWSVAESLPVHEDIKTRSGQFQKHIENYTTSIRNLARCGVDTICYNFMPVLDWSRTDLEVEFEDGSITTQFEAKVFAAFDIFILKRPHAENSYGESLLHQAKQYYEGLSEVEKEKLMRTALLGFPGSGEAYSMERLKVTIEGYRDVGDVALRENLSSFLKAIIPVAEESGVLMAIHPDDPPWSLLGLPRIVSNKRDVEQLLGVLDSPSNGITLCTGSFGAAIQNDLIDMTTNFARRINFIHLRNVTRNSGGDFIEDNHLDGDVDMYSVMKTLLLEQKRRTDEGREDTRMPMRPDHGHLMLADRSKQGIYPGYSLFGRMRAIAELRGMELGIRRSLGL